MIPFTFHPEAEVEFADAAEFYESRMVGLGQAFIAEVERCVALVWEQPDVGSPAGSNRRRVVVGRFPYSVVYRTDPQSILILAIAHQRRRPGYWRRRK